MRSLGLACAAALLLASAACGDSSPAGRPARAPGGAMQSSIGASEDSLNLVIWAGFTANDSTAKTAEWVKPFERKTGCRTTATLTDSSDATTALMRSGRYDGVLAPGDASLQFILDGKVAPLNTKLLRNYDDLAPYLRDQPANSLDGRTYGMPHGYGADYLIYRTDKLPVRPTSWNVVWDKDSPAAGHIVDYDSPTYIADAALYLKAHRPDLKITDVFELTQEQFDAAVDLLKQQRPIVNQYWSNFMDEVQSFKTADNYAGTGFQMAADLARRQGAPVAMTIPREGATGWSQTWMIAGRAAHPNCMYKWMNWITTPKVQAEVAQWFGEAPANPKACAYAAKGFCTAFHAGDEDFYRRLAFWKTPVVNCGDSRGPVCVDYSRWTDLWSQIKG